MPVVHLQQHDFRRGRVGPGMIRRTDTRAYQSAVAEAANMMVLSDGRLARRWGSKLERVLTDETRIEAWEYGFGDTLSFLLCFQPGRLLIYDLTGAERANLSSAVTGWTAQTMWFLTFAAESNQVFICDASQRPAILTYDPDTDTFDVTGFRFELSDDETRLRAPFHSFSGDIEFTTDIFNTPGTSTGFGPYIASAGGFGGTADVTLGTGTLTASADFFKPAHVGTRMRMLGGELEITAYTSATEVSVAIKRDLAVRLEPDPLSLTNGSKIVEVFWDDHGLSPGDEVFIYGIESGKDVLTGAPGSATDSSTVVAPLSGTASSYTVKRVIGPGSFEIEGDATAPATEIVGGTAVDIIPFTPVKGIEEPAISAARGWPQACGFWQRRFWMGGSNGLPDAVFGSTFGNPLDFDTGDGAATDAVQLKGIGRQTRIRHIAPTFDMLLFGDNSEHYVAGSFDAAVSQETARVLPATDHGCAYTTPATYDNATFFIDPYGRAVRELRAETRDTDYVAPPVTAVVPDWVSLPSDVTVFDGTPQEQTPYAMWVGADGALLVMHSQRADDALGFMRWTMADPWSFTSIAGIGERLYAVITDGSSYELVQFRSYADGREHVLDRSTHLTGDQDTEFTVTSYQLDDVLRAIGDGEVLPDVTVGEGGAISLPQPTDSLTVGLPISWRVESLPPALATGQGSKAGKMQRITRVEVDFDAAYDGVISGQTVFDPEDAVLFGAVQPVGGWREFWLGEWSRDPRLVIESDNDALPVTIRGWVINAYI